MGVGHLCVALDAPADDGAGQQGVVSAYAGVAVSVMDDLIADNS
jgi:hypothetical protein